MAKCKHCDKTILFVKAHNGDWKPTEPNFTTIITNTGEIYTGRKIHVCRNADAQRYQRPKTQQTRAKGDRKKEMLDIGF